MTKDGRFLFATVADLDWNMEHCEFDGEDYVCMPMAEWKERVDWILDDAENCCDDVPES